MKECIIHGLRFTANRVFWMRGMFHTKVLSLLNLMLHSTVHGLVMTKMPVKYSQHTLNFTRACSLTWHSPLFSYTKADLGVDSCSSYLCFSFITSLYLLLPVQQQCSFSVSLDASPWNTQSRTS